MMSHIYADGVGSTPANWTDKVLHSTLYTPAAVGVSTIFFFVLNLAVNVNIPQSAKSEWKFKNIALSLVHAVISGLWALYCLVSTPQMAEDVIRVYDLPSYTLVCFTTGYVLYDSLDMLLYHRKRESFELLGHHAVILVAFGISIFNKMYIGYAVVSLTAEVNSIFLHIRQLLLICRFSKTQTLYKINSLSNIVTFITFRIMTFAWMTRWLFLNKDLVPLMPFTVGSIGLAIITFMNIVLFYRLLQSDYFHSIPTENKLD